MTKYKSTNNNAMIIPVEAERESDHFIWIKGQQNKKHSDFVHYFDSWREAYEKLVETANNNVASASYKLGQARSHLGKVKELIGQDDNKKLRTIGE